MAEKIKLSVCIATLGEPEAMQSLRTNFAGLASAADWELILVVNGRRQPPTDESFWSALPFVVKILHEPRPGKSRALNIAIGAATGELLVFTDDDVVPDELWLDRLAAAALAQPQITVFGGRIHAQGVVPDWIRVSSNLQQALLCEHDYGDRDRIYPPGHYPIGPNMAVRRCAVEKHRAKWIETIGPGTSLPVGDESSFLAQISPLDAQDRYYVASALVHHTVDGRYFPLKKAIRRAFQIGLSGGRLAASKPMSPGAAKTAALGLPARVVTRIRELRSLRELLCVLARAAGVLVGSFFHGATKGTAQT